MPADSLQDLTAAIWDEDTGTWRFVDNDVSYSTADDTVTIELPLVGVRYAVVDLDGWRNRARACDLAASGGRVPLDVEVVFDGTDGLALAGQPGAKQAIDAVLGTLRPGDEVVSTRVFGFVWTSFGFGGANLPDYEEVDSPQDDASTHSIANAVQRIQAPVDIRPRRARAVTGRGLAVRRAGTGHLQLRRPGVPTDQDGAGQCRQPAVVLVTDGLVEPEEPTEPAPTDGSYVPFLQRTEPPVHVLNIGGGSQWLEDVATRTGGSYSSVPAVVDMSQWMSDVDAPTAPDPSTDLTLDSDEDGVVDWIEIDGVTDAGVWAPGQRYTSDPHDSDSDDDGMLDGDELGMPLTAAEMGGWASALPIQVHWVLSNPSEPDSDFDGPHRPV